MVVQTALSVVFKLACLFRKAQFQSYVVFSYLLHQWRLRNSGSSGLVFNYDLQFSVERELALYICCATTNFTDYGF